MDGGMDRKERSLPAACRCRCLIVAVAVYRKESKGAVAVKDGGIGGMEGWMDRSRCLAVKDS